MSMQKSKKTRTAYIDDESKHIQDNYDMAGAWKVMRSEDVKVPYITQYLLHIHRHGIEEPNADVIVHLVQKDIITQFGLHLYLWQDQLWNSNTNIDNMANDAGVMTLTRIGDLSG